MPKTLKPGEKSPFSGQVGIIGRRGGDTGKERTITKGERLPPTPKPGQSYVINDRSKNNAGRGR